MQNKIYLDLKKSPYKYKIGCLEFYFSSKFYLNKFKKEGNKYAENESLKFAIKYKVTANLYTIFLISYYKKVEKRGFRIVETRKNEEIKENLMII